ncbi:MAG TPA: Hsp20/alpha crystallin family protein [Pirellulaceae bacterium]|jgi:HSP20 family protein
MTHTCKPRWSASFPDSVEREVSQIFDHFFGPTGGQKSSSVFAPSALWEEEGRWGLEVELPGVQLNDIDITLEKDALRVTAERHAPEAGRKYIHQERGYGKVQRLIKLPETVDPDNIEAELKDGVLRLYLQKRPELQPKKIQVKTA